MLRATLHSAATVVLGILTMVMITRAIAGGVTLPAGIKDRLPRLEHRVNELVPNILNVLRLGVFVVVITAVGQAWGLFDPGDWLASDAGRAVARSLVSVALTLLVAALLWLALSSWIEFRLNPHRARQPGPRVRTLLALLRNAATVVIATVTFMLVLSEVGVNIAPLLAGAGVLGLAVGFGAQKLVQDIITGAFIQFENAINEGEVVTVAGINGTVEHLTIRSVGLRDLQGVYHIIPFSSVDSVSNFMRGFGYHVAEIGIAYRENIDEARALMHEAFDELRQDPELGAGDRRAAGLARPHRVRQLRRGRCGPASRPGRASSGRSGGPTTRSSSGCSTPRRAAGTWPVSGLGRAGRRAAGVADPAPTAVRRMPRPTRRRPRRMKRGGRAGPPEAHRPALAAVREPSAWLSFAAPTG